jgi:tetratricopeptide (TPR) repeat protein
MTSVVRWVEVHRLAVAGREAGIAREVGGRVGVMWLARSRFADVARLAGLTLTLGEDARAFYQLGWAKDATGDRTAALAAYDQALRLYRAAGDRGNEAATLGNIGGVYDGLGERQRALEYFGQALPITREVGDRAGEAATLNNIGAVYHGVGEPRRALEHYGQALPIRREVGDRAGEAVTLNNIGAVYDGLGDPQRARFSSSARRAAWGLFSRPSSAWSCGESQGKLVASLMGGIVPRIPWRSTRVCAAAGGKNA